MHPQSTCCSPALHKLHADRCNETSINHFLWFNCNSNMVLILKSWHKKSNAHCHSSQAVNEKWSKPGQSWSKCSTLLQWFDTDCWLTGSANYPQSFAPEHSKRRNPKGACGCGYNWMIADKTVDLKLVANCEPNAGLQSHVQKNTNSDQVSFTAFTTSFSN